MTSDGYTCELQGQACWPARVHSTTSDGLLEELGRLLACEAVLAPFTITFTDPVPSEVRDRLCAVVLEAIRTGESDHDHPSAWIDDLVDESGWQGMRATIDPALDGYRATGRRVVDGLVQPEVRVARAEAAVALHATALFEDGDVPVLRGDEVLAELLHEIGYEEGQEFLSFCGAGYMAAIDYFAARLLGLSDVRMYDGSLIDWTARGGALLPSGGRM